MLVAVRDALGVGGLIGEPEPQGVRPVPLDGFQRVDHIPLGLRHLPASRVPDQAVDDHVAEGLVVRQIQPAHDHPGHPQIQDVVASDQRVRRVEEPEIRGVVGPPERGERPELRREPGIEDVRILLQLPALAFRARQWILERGKLMPVAAVPHRDAVPPPQLARDVPVAQPLQPLHVGVDPARRPEGDAAVHGSLSGRPLQLLHGHEPLLAGDPRLDLRVASIAVPHAVHVRPLDVHDLAHLAQALEHPGPRRVPIQTPELLGCGVRDLGLGRQDVAERQPLSLPDLEVGGVVRRRELDSARPEARVDRVVCDYRQLLPGEGVPDALADQRAVSVVLRMDGDAGVAEHRLDPSGGDIDVPGAVREVVAEGDQLAIDIFVLHFRVRQRRLVPGTPVDDPLATVDQAVLVHADERDADRPGQAFVHGEAQPVPVAGVSEGLHLLDDPVAVLLFPRPHAFDELLSAQGAPVDPFFHQLAFHHDLGGDPGVIGPRQPKRLEPLHSLSPDHDVLVELLERVADVQRARDVRRREDDAERPAVRAGSGPEVATPLPLGVPAPLRGVRFVSGRHLGTRRRVRDRVLLHARTSESLGNSGSPVLAAGGGRRTDGEARTRRRPARVLLRGFFDRPLTQWRV